MIKFEKFTLSNGLRVIVHKDESTSIAAFNLLYDVGARDESESRTGFAHLFEHLMFGGSVNIPNFDQPLQRVGGQSNAFTSNDITNYYITVPTANLETAFWLESDRMLDLAFTDKSLETQRSVVVEEFKQRYLNQPYGNVWLLLRPLVYKKHPYKWATIGKEISHIEQATMEEVKSFFYKHYSPENAVLTVSGNIEFDEVRRLSEKWFGPIQRKSGYNRSLPHEPKQQEERLLEVYRNVPASAIYKVFRMPGRMHKEYYIVDLISDILARGESSRLHQELVKEKKLFSEISAYVNGSTDDGLLVISGKLSQGVGMDEANESIVNVLDELVLNPVTEIELTKVKNKAESTRVFSEMSVLNKAMNLSIFELYGDANLVNLEDQNYAEVSVQSIQNSAKSLFRKENTSTVYYHAKN